MKTIKVTEVVTKEIELSTLFKKVIDKPCYNYTPTKQEHDCIIDLIREHKDYIGLSFPYQVVTNGYGQFKSVRFDGRELPICKVFHKLLKL